MSEFKIETISPLAIKAELSNLWKHCCETNQIGNSIAIALPILMADGWQTVVYLEQLTPKRISLRDKGALSSWLMAHGLNIESQSIYSIIQQEMQKFNILEDEKGFYAHYEFPLDARKIHLFGSFLSSISHLIYRLTAYTNPQFQAYSSVINIAREFNLDAKEKISYQTPCRDIVVDLSFIREQKTILFQTFDQSSRADDILEMWSYRMKEISETKSTQFKTGLIYNEESFQPKSHTLRLAQKNCDLVCPHTHTNRIKKLLQPA